MRARASSLSWAYTSGSSSAAEWGSPAWAPARALVNSAPGVGDIAFASQKRKNSWQPFALIVGLRTEGCNNDFPRPRNAIPTGGNGGFRPGHPDAAPAPAAGGRPALAIPSQARLVAWR